MKFPQKVAAWAEGHGEACLRSDLRQAELEIAALRLEIERLLDEIVRLRDERDDALRVISDLRECPEK